MKTKRTPLQWVGHVTGVVFFVATAFIPTIAYATIWWTIPKTFWPIFCAVVLAVAWCTTQLIWGLYVALCWDGLHDDRPWRWKKYSDERAKRGGRVNPVT